MAKKAAKKKAKVKKAEAKAPAADKLSKSSARGHSLEDPMSDDIGEKARQIISAVSARFKNRPINLVSAAEMQKNMLPIGHFFLQYLIGSYGIPEATTIEFIGDKKTGKTTLALMIAGGIMAQTGAWPLYIGCENKNPNMARFKRCLHPHAPTAAKLAKNVQVADAFSLTQMWYMMRMWVATMRGKEKAVIQDGKRAESVCVPNHIPLIIIVDPITRLLDPEEEIGQFDFGTNMSADNVKNKKEVGTHKGRATAAKWLHEFARHLPHWSASNNVMCIFIEHQNDEMHAKKGAGGVELPKSFTELFNSNHRGGRGTGQVASLQLILAASGRQAKAPAAGSVATGEIIRMRTEKQSYGPTGRVIEFELRSEFTRDSQFFTEPPIIFDEAFAQWLVKQGLFGLTVDKGAYTSSDLRVYAGSAEDVSMAITNDKETLNRLGAQQRIEGYYDVDNSEEIKPPDVPAEEAVADDEPDEDSEDGPVIEAQ